MVAQKILIIEDEPEMTELLAFNLEAAGYQVVIAHDGQEGLAAALRHHPDLVLLDVMLPGVSGTDVCRSLRRNRKLAEVPIIFITARNDEIDRVLGFELGADDYVVKPFSVRELLLRVKAVLRRGPTPMSSGTVLKIGAMSIDSEKYEASHNGIVVPLTAIEFKLLQIFAQHAGVVLGREALLKQVWGANYSGDIRTVDTHITRLRGKLGEAGNRIKTVRGFGYLFEPCET